MAVEQDSLQTEYNHLYWIDLIRVVAVFQVILIHLSYVIFFKEEVLSANWRAANFYDSCSRMGVPLFFMASGVLLLGKREPIKDFFCKRFVKVGIPTLVWSLAYLLWSVDAYTNGTMNPVGVALSILKAIYTGNVELHLWFLYILIGIYLIVPLLRIFVSAASRRDLVYFGAMWFLASPLLELGQRLSGLQTALVIPVVAGYVGYFVIGYWLADVNLGRRGFFLATLGCIMAIAVTYYGTNWLSAASAPIDTYFYSYFSPATVLASICGFLILKELGQNLGNAGRVVRAVAGTAFGIYLIHIFMVELLRRGALGFRLYSWQAPSVYMIPLTALAVYLISSAIVFGVQKVPLLKKLVP
jgi:surface polysaccharide O-acyltransferase-like enzyme